VNSSMISGSLSCANARLCEQRLPVRQLLRTIYVSRSETSGLAFVRALPRTWGSTSALASQAVTEHSSEWRNSPAFCRHPRPPWTPGQCAPPLLRRQLPCWLLLVVVHGVTRPRQIPGQGARPRQARH
jgi:hypothetical protein